MEEVKWKVHRISWMLSGYWRLLNLYSISVSIGTWIDTANLYYKLRYKDESKCKLSYAEAKVKAQKSKSSKNTCNSKIKIKWQDEMD